jgi:hypothetical protein
VFGGSECSYSEETEVNKSAVKPLPIGFVHDEDELMILAKNNNSLSLSSSAIPLSLAALNGPLQLNGSNTSNRNSFFKSIFKNNGTLFNAVSMTNEL